MKFSVIICAAGKGLRAGFKRNKLTAPFYGSTALDFTIRAFINARNAIEAGGDELIEIIATCAKNDIEARAICLSYGIKTVDGGDTRTASVYNALKEVAGEAVLIHDGARPFVTEDIILSCINCVKEHKSAICAMPATDTITISDGNWAGNMPERSKIYHIQTPQGFMTPEIKSAYEKATTSGDAFTDDGSVYSRFISPARLCLCGTSANKKLTTAEDFKNAAPFPPLTVMGDGTRVGFGVDIHAFGDDKNYVTLCGVKIPCDQGLVAHSDGDVAVHAVMDALLSAAGLKDIGHYFPDSDDKLRGADSIELLKKVVVVLGERGYSPASLSISVQAEKPRLSRYIDEMKKTVAEACKIECDKVAVSAGTCEGLGFVGEGRGICAYCAAVISAK